MKILQFLLLIRLRKILPKDDYTAIGLVLVLYAALIFALDKVFLKYDYYFLLGSLEIVTYHKNRKDLEFLQTSKNYKLILFSEYAIYSFPFLIIYCLHLRWDLILLHFLIMYTLLFLTRKIDFKIVKYPFKLLDPFWHISFRKNYLFVFIPIIILLNFLGNEYHNENLNIASLFITSFICCVPSFQREEIIHIKASIFSSKEYLLKQIQVTVYNTFLIGLVLSASLIGFQKWDLLVFIPLIFLMPIIALLFKYCFFSHTLLQQIFFALFLGTMQTGLPFLIIPYLYYKSIKTINTLVYVKD